MNTTNLDAARAHHADMGGWLLDLGDGNYLATDDEAIVRDLRGQAFLDECERCQCWDETQPPAPKQIEE